MKKQEKPQFPLTAALIFAISNHILIVMKEIARVAEQGNDGMQSWDCIRSKVKQERLAEQCLLRCAGVEAFAPRIKLRRRTRRGPVWFVEALFPGYLFARFSLEHEYRLVSSTLGVSGVLRFGDQVPSLADSSIRELWQAMGDEGVALVEDVIRAGDMVNVAAGPFRGLTGLVKWYLPPSGRIRVLMEFMGRPLEVDMHETSATLLEPRYVGPALNSA